ncbi:Monothiol glutaredoxin-S17 [Acorus calamus]|uniref:Monothiol glutaredoxin-S17 n=1 Tax=Acorus calamus TaxID=4465 RepID=A0AAV9E8M8_ACOCL|nr:Monothiol glutaredoxin-S17 [Acorus calamus]
MGGGGGGGGGVMKDLRSKEELDRVIRGGESVILHFFAGWCEASKQMDQVFALLCTDFPLAHFFRVDAEELPELSEAYFVSAVPYFVFCKDGKTVDTLEGANPSSLANKVAELTGSIDHADSAAPANLRTAAGPAVLETVKEQAKGNDSSQTEKPSLNERLQQLVDSHPVFLFMKGSPEQPKCKFSRKVVEILKDEGVEFGSFDILTDDEVREGMKKFSNWPTFPQLYCKGEFIGGCDITVAMHESGELKEVFKDHGVLSHSNGAKTASGLSSALISRLESLINLSLVMLFMKGKPEEPKCGFSGKVVEILQQEKVEFESFDILTDDEVRQGLKVFSNWLSYPQLYIKGKLIGGSDIVLEMQKSGELKRVLAEEGILPKEPLEDRLRSLISSSEAMLFMKGSPDNPRCGFSRKVVDALREVGVTFGHFDILTDDDVRQGLKTFSNWPTYPQLYYKGEFIGGSDIVLEMQKSGELKSALSE